jgi:hypothetical protein
MVDSYGEVARGPGWEVQMLYDDDRGSDDFQPIDAEDLEARDEASARGRDIPEAVADLIIGVAEDRNWIYEPDRVRVALSSAGYAIPVEVVRVVLARWRRANRMR